MRLKMYNTSNSGKEVIAYPCFVTVSKWGQISFSSTLTEKLDLTRRKISFAEDKDKPGQWYMILDLAEGFQIRNYRQNKNKTRAAFMNNRIVANAIFQTIESTQNYKSSPDYTRDSFRIPVQTSPVEDQTFSILIQESFPSKFSYGKFNELRHRQIKNGEI